MFPEKAHHVSIRPEKSREFTVKRPYMSIHGRQGKVKKKPDNPFFLLTTITITVKSGQVERNQLIKYRCVR